MKFKKKNTVLSNHIFCYDIETSSADPYSCEPLEFAGMVVDINTLEVKDDGIFGPILVRPPKIAVVDKKLGGIIYQYDWDSVEEKALQVNGLTREEIEKNGVDQDEFFRQLTDFLQKFQKSKSMWSALYPAGFNIKGFDNIICARLCHKYDYVENGRAKLFHPIHTFDLMDYIRPWFESTNSLEGYSLADICSYMGLENTGAHEALSDVKTTWTILQRFMRFYRAAAPKYLPKFKGCFSNV